MIKPNLQLAKTYFCDWCEEEKKNDQFEIRDNKFICKDCLPSFTNYLDRNM